MSVASLVAMMLLLGACGSLGDVLGDDSATEAVDSVSTTLAEFDVDTYCSISHEVDRVNNAFTQFDDPVALEGFFTSLTSLLGQVTPPPEIAADFVRYNTAYVDLQAQLAANDYNILVLSQSPILSDASVNAAIVAVDAYDLQTCGVAPGLEPPSAEEAVGEDQTSGGDALADAIAAGDFSVLEPLFDSPELRAEFIEGLMSSSGVTEEQAGCFYDLSSIPLLAQMTVDASSMTDDMEQELLANFDACGISLYAFQTG